MVGFLHTSWKLNQGITIYTKSNWSKYASLCRAFCNPADVEAFTKEKKDSLLSKRHGKGADFVRAVREIIDSYEKLKKQVQVDDVNTTGPTNVVKSEESVATIWTLYLLIRPSNYEFFFCQNQLFQLLGNCTEMVPVF